MAIIVAIDADHNTAVIVEIENRDLPKIKKEFINPNVPFGGIRHFKDFKNEPRRKKNAYLCWFIRKLRELERKYQINYHFYPNTNSYFWNTVGYYLKSPDVGEIIIDNGLYNRYKKFFDNVQAPIMIEGDITKHRKCLLKKIREAEKNKDVIQQERLERELDIYLQRWVAITIADNYIHYKQRRGELECQK